MATEAIGSDADVICLTMLNTCGKCSKAGSACGHSRSTKYAAPRPERFRVRGPSSIFAAVKSPIISLVATSEDVEPN